MFARALAVCCLIYAVSPAVAGDDTSALSTVDLYLDAGVNGNAPALASMRKEADALMQQAGFRIAWRVLGDGARDIAAPNLTILRLDGVCAPAAAGRQITVPDGLFSLASTSVTDGVVLPYSQIHCTALAGELEPALAKLPPPIRTAIYGRAMGRLVAHELYHVLSHTTDHAAEGVSKPCFTVSDLTAERFAFAGDALAKLRLAAPEKPAGAGAETAADR